MRKPAHVLEIFLQPGELYFGNRNTRIRTVLGSCVSMVFWHPELLVGGMSHYMLPSGKGYRAGRPLDGRYADEAVAMMMQEIEAVGAPHWEYQAKVFGGGDMFSCMPKSAASQVGHRNVEAARRLMAEHGFSCVAEHLGGTGHRNVIFDIWSGHVWMKHQPQAVPCRLPKEGEAPVPVTSASPSSLYGRLGSRPDTSIRQERVLTPCSR